MEYQLVPFDPAWADINTCPDVHAIYRRRRNDRWGRPVLDAEGREQWDYITYPLRQHQAAMLKGMHYVTLASNADLADAKVIQSLLARNLSPQMYLNGPGRRVWDAELFLIAEAVQADEDLVALKADIEQFGAEAVVAIRRRTDPTFVLPESLKPKGSGGPAPKGAPK